VGGDAAWDSGQNQTQIMTAGDQRRRARSLLATKPLKTPLRDRMPLSCITVILLRLLFSNLGNMANPFN
jgi:hypothetical protein